MKYIHIYYVIKFTGRKNKHNNYDRMITVQSFIVEVVSLSWSNRDSVNTQNFLLDSFN